MFIAECWMPALLSCQLSRQLQNILGHVVNFPCVSVAAQLIACTDVARKCAALKSKQKSAFSLACLLHLDSPTVTSPLHPPPSVSPTPTDTPPPYTPLQADGVSYRDFPLALGLRCSRFKC